MRGRPDGLPGRGQLNFAFLQAGTASRLWLAEREPVGLVRSGECALKQLNIVVANGWVMVRMPTEGVIDKWNMQEKNKCYSLACQHFLSLAWNPETIRNVTCNSVSSTVEIFKFAGSFAGFLYVMIISMPWLHTEQRKSANPTLDAPNSNKPTLFLQQSV
jgi:hypothetical protein